MRRNYEEVPSVAELANTLEREAKRDIPLSKQNIHYFSLDSLKEFLTTIGFSVPAFDRFKTWQEVLIEGEVLQRKLIPYILDQNGQQIVEPAIKLYQYLSQEDKPEPADIILAFGAKTPARAEKAIELYKKGLAPKILFSGRGASFVDNVTETEADNYAGIAREAGVDESALILEREAITLPDNVRRSFNMLDEMQISYKRIILVNSPYSQLRGYGYAEKYSPVGTAIFRVNCETKNTLREDKWFETEEGIKAVIGEYRRLWVSLAANSL